MSRSYKKTPIIGIAEDVSEKKDKVRAQRKERNAVNRFLRRIDEDEWDGFIPITKPTFDPWSAAKDGKGWFDEEKHPEYLRK